MLKQVAGAHVQSWTDDAKKLVRQKCGSLKILNTANSVDLVQEFVNNNPDAPVCCRLVTSDNLSEADKLVEDSIREFERLLPIVNAENLWLEDGINEAYQSGEELGYRNDAVENASIKINNAGFRPVGFNFSVANPPKIINATVNGELITPETSDMRFIQGAAHALMENNGAIGYHNYSVPTSFLSDWYDLRHRRMRQELPVDIKFFLGEGAFDHGIIDGRLAGWRDDTFHLSAEDFSRYVRGWAQELTKDNSVIAWTPFGAGAYSDWHSFEYANENIVTSIFSEQYEVAEDIIIGQGFQKFIAYLGQPLENEVYHWPGTPLETSVAVFENGCAMWYKVNNEVIAQRSDGAVFHDRGNNGDGVTVWRLY
jgi:hypothetical protein